MYGALNPAQKKSLGRVDSNGRHLLAIINEILDITRIEAGRMPLSISSFRLVDLIDEVMQELEPIVAVSTVRVVIDVSPRLPRAKTDRQKVKQVVLNLLSNALKFTHEGVVRIHAEHDEDRRTLAISVADTGIGISASDREKVFEDFHQVDNSPTRPYGGTGLGLAICRRLAAMLDGTLALESEIGQGSTFTLTIPLKHTARRR
jgi:signal transduction histidine kinase